MEPAEALLEIERVLAEHGTIFWQRFNLIREIVDSTTLTPEQRKQVEAHREYGSHW
jgi:hypothetical protein